MAVGDVYLAGSTPDGLYRSQDGGATWGPLIAAPAGQSFVSGVAVDARNGDVWLSGATPDGLYRSQDGGATWGPLIAAPAGQTGVRGVAIDARNGDVYLAGGSPRGIHRSQDAGATWGALIAAPAGQSVVTGVAIDSRNGDVWLSGATPDGLYRSQDGGATWGALIAPPTGQSIVTDVAIDTSNGDVWLSGSTPDGLYRSQDGGATWGALIAAPAGQTTVQGVRLQNPPPTPDAEAPTITVAAPDADEGGTSQITATPAGGTYDAISYEYQIVSGPASVNASGLITATAVTSDQTVTYRARPIATGNGTDAADGSSNTGAWVQGTITVSNVPVLTTDTDSVYRLAATQPTTPTAGTGTETHTPTGWTRAAPDATATEGVWRSQRTRSFSDGSFTSATAWGTATEITPALGVSLALTDWSQPAGTVNVVLALIRADVSGVDLFDEPGDSVEGDLVIGDDLSLDQVERRGLPDSPVRLRRTGTSGFNEYFGSGDIYEGAKFWIQTSATNVIEFVERPGGPGGGFYNWNYADSNDATAYEGISTGDLFIVAITIEEPTGTDHAVAAGGIGVGVAVSSAVRTLAEATDHAVAAVGIGVAIAVGQAAVTLAGPAGTVHAVDAGGIGVGVEVSATARTFVGTTDHAVSASGIGVGVAVSAAARTLAGAMGTDHAVDAGNIGVAVAVSAAARTLAEATDHAVAASAIGVGVAVSAASRTLTGAVGAVHAVAAGGIGVGIGLTAASVTHTGTTDHTVNASGIGAGVNLSAATVTSAEAEDHAVDATGINVGVNLAEPNVQGIEPFAIRVTGLLVIPDDGTAIQAIVKNYRGSNPFSVAAGHKLRIVRL